MSLNRGQIFKPFRYQHINGNSININTKDPLISLTLLFINYTERESIIAYQHQIDILSANILRLLEQDSIQKKDFHYQESILGMYFEDFIGNVNTIHVEEEAKYHLEILIREISSIPPVIYLKIQNNQNSFLKKTYSEWTHRKNAIDTIFNQHLLGEKIHIFKLIVEPQQLEDNHTMNDLFYKVIIMITIVGVIFLLIAIFKNNT